VLEPCNAKVLRTVLRGLGASNRAWLLGIQAIDRKRTSTFLDLQPCRPLRVPRAVPTAGSTVPFADFCDTIEVNRFTLSHESVTCHRSSEVSSTAFDGQPPDLPPVSLMDMGFAIICPLARHRRPPIRFLFIGSRLCSALLSGPASRRVLFHPCASL
jgi:hypothetical protein